MMKKACVIGRPKDCHRYCEGKCEYCDWYNSDVIYPHFTAEKQIDIIKIISKINIDNYSCISLDYDTNTQQYICMLDEYNNNGIHVGVELGKNQCFAQALVKLTCRLIDDNKINKDIVKEILE